MTVADLARQALIARRLAADVPNDPVLAEEDASWLRGELAGAVSAQVVSVVRQVVFDACTEQVIHRIDRGAGKANSRFWTLDPIDAEAEISRQACAIVRTRLCDSRREVAKRAEIVEIIVREGDL